jgi:hypothetical protein
VKECLLGVHSQVNWHKGTALEHLLGVLGLRGSADVVALYIGDDHTDEDAFRALKESNQGGLLADSVGDTLHCGSDNMPIASAATLTWCTGASVGALMAPVSGFCYITMYVVVAVVTLGQWDPHVATDQPRQCKAVVRPATCWADFARDFAVLSAFYLFSVDQLDTSLRWKNSGG